MSKPFLASLLVASLFLMNFSSGGETTLNVDGVIKEVEKYGNYTLPEYDREKAVKIIEEYIKINKDKVETYDHIKLLTFIGRLYTIHSRSDKRDEGRGCEYWKQAVAEAGDKVCVDVIDNLHNLTKNKDERLWLKNLISFNLRTAYLALLPNEELKKVMLWPWPESERTPEKEAKEIKQLRFCLKTSQEISSENIINMATNMKDGLAVINQYYYPGVALAEKINEAWKERRKSPEPKNDETKKETGAPAKSEPAKKRDLNSE